MSRVLLVRFACHDLFWDFIVDCQDCFSWRLFRDFIFLSGWASFGRRRFLAVQSFEDGSSASFISCFGSVSSAIWLVVKSISRVAPFIWPVLRRSLVRFSFSGNGFAFRAWVEPAAHIMRRYSFGVHVLSLFRSVFRFPSWVKPWTNIGKPSWVSLWLSFIAPKSVSRSWIVQILLLISSIWLSRAWSFLIDGNSCSSLGWLVKAIVDPIGVRPNLRFILLRSRFFPQIIRICLSSFERIHSCLSCRRLAGHMSIQRFLRISHVTRNGSIIRIPSVSIG